MTNSLTHELATPPSESTSTRPADRPGVLRGGATLTLQTRQAQRLVKGRGYSVEKPAIIGLIGFANLVRSIWHGARADDPYADWWILKIHAALDRAERDLGGVEQAIARRFETLAAIEVASPASIKPARIALNFSNPYAFRAAHLLAHYDAVVRTVLSARHVGLLRREETERMMHLAGRAVRRALQSAVGYQIKGVTRTDVEQGNAKAQLARTAMGEIPGEILSGMYRAPHAPTIARPTTAPLTDPVTLRMFPDSG